MATPFHAQLALVTRPLYVEMDLLLNSTSYSNLLLVESINFVIFLSSLLKTKIPLCLWSRDPSLLSNPLEHHIRNLKTFAL